MGGAVLVGRGIKLEITDLTVEHCRAGYLGGGLAVQFEFAGPRAFQPVSRTNITIKSSVFHNNTAGCGGGAAAVLDLNPEVDIEWTNITDNSASCGGALFMDLGVATLTTRNCLFQRNRASSGGAILVPFDANLTISDSSFDSNQALASWPVPRATTPFCFSAGGSTRIYPGSGGALDLQEATVRITDTVFTNSFATRGGGFTAVDMRLRRTWSTWAVDDDLTGNTLLRVAFINNTATKYGGAFFVASAPFSVLDSLVLSNRAQKGGGVVAAGYRAVVFRNTRVVKNHASGDGGGILMKEGVTLQLQNSLFDSNYAGMNGGALQCTEYGRVSVEYSSYVSNIVNPDGSGGAIALAQFCTLFLENVGMAFNSAGVDESAQEGLRSSPGGKRPERKLFTGGAGGALYVLPQAAVSIELLSVHLLANRALQQGGALAMFDLERLDISLTDVTFIKNSCQYQGGGAMLTDFQVRCINCTLSNNSAVYAEDFMTTDISLRPVLPPYNTSGVVRVASGEVLPTLQLQLVDSYLNEITLASYTELLVLESNASQTSGSRERLVNGLVTFADVAVKSHPGTSLQLEISNPISTGSACPLLHGVIRPFHEKLIFTVLIQDCVEGEGLSEDHLVCEVCNARNGYSISPGQPCVLCLEDEIVESTTCVSKWTASSRFFKGYGILLLTGIGILVAFVFIGVQHLRHNFLAAKLEEEEIALQQKDFENRYREQLFYKSKEEFISQIARFFYAAAFNLKKYNTDDSDSDDSDISEEGGSIVHFLNQKCDLLLQGGTSPDHLPACFLALKNGLTFCDNQQLYDKVLMSKYVCEQRPVNLREKLATQFKDKHLDLSLDDSFPQNVLLEDTLLFSLLNIAFNNARRYGGGEAKTYLRCQLLSPEASGFAGHGLEARLSNEPGADDDRALIIATQELWVPTSHPVSKVCTELELCRAMAKLLPQGKLDLSFDRSDFHFHLVMSCVPIEDSVPLPIIDPASLAEWANIPTAESGPHSRLCDFGVSDLISPQASTSDTVPSAYEALGTCDEADSYATRGYNFGEYLYSSAWSLRSEQIYEGADLYHAFPASSSANADGGQSLGKLSYSVSTPQRHSLEENDIAKRARSVTYPADMQLQPKNESSSGNFLEGGTSRLPEGLRYAVAQDNRLPLHLSLKHFVNSTLKGSTKSFFYGKDRTDLLGFVDKVLSMDPPVDICILDQSLDDPHIDDELPMKLGE
eukprot:gene5786-6979_t